MTQYYLFDLDHKSSVLKYIGQKALRRFRLEILQRIFRSSMTFYYISLENWFKFSIQKLPYLSCILEVFTMIQVLFVQSNAQWLNGMLTSWSVGAYELWLYMYVSMCLLPRMIADLMFLVINLTIFCPFSMSHFSSL